MLISELELPILIFQKGPWGIHTNALYLELLSQKERGAGAAAGLTHPFGTCEGHSREGVSVNHDRDPLMEFLLHHRSETMWEIEQ